MIYACVRVCLGDNAPERTFWFVAEDEAEVENVSVDLFDEWLSYLPDDLEIDDPESQVELYTTQAARPEGVTILNEV